MPLDDEPQKSGQALVVSEAGTVEDPLQLSPYDLRCDRWHWFENTRIFNTVQGFKTLFQPSRACFLRHRAPWYSHANRCTADADRLRLLGRVGGREMEDECRSIDVYGRHSTQEHHGAH